MADALPLPAVMLAGSRSAKLRVIRPVLLVDAAPESQSFVLLSSDYVT